MDQLFAVACNLSSAALGVEGCQCLEGFRRHTGGRGQRPHRQLGGLIVGEVGKNGGVNGTRLGNLSAAFKGFCLMKALGD